MLPPPSALSLQPGRGVLYQGDEWLIEEAKEFTRVLCRRVSDGRRDFLPIQELGPVGDNIARDDAVDEEFDSIVDEIVDPGDEDVCDEPQRESGWRAFMRRRILATPPVEHQQRAKHEKAMKEATEMFQEALAIHREPVAAMRRIMRDKFAEKWHCSIQTVYRKVQFARVYESAEAMMRAKRSDTGTTKHGERTWELMDKELADKRFVPEKTPVREIRLSLNVKLKREGLAKVSKSLIQQRINEKTHRDRLLTEGRKEEARNSYRHSVGHLPDADWPLAIVQIDHSPCQIVFVDSKSRKPIGDAWLTLVIDCYSRMILGFHLSFDAPSTLNFGLALAHACLPKEEFLKRVGVGGEWPCWGMPDMIYMDNASEFSGHMVQRARRRYRFDIRHRPVGQPQLGGHVERAFRTYMEESKTLQGTKFANPTERADYPSEEKAVLTLDEFEQLFTDFLLNEYHIREHTGDGMERRAPLQRWKAGIFEGDIFPARGLPDIPLDARLLRISMMPVMVRTVKKGTVQMFGLKYHSGALGELSDGLDVRRRKGDDREFSVHYDPRDITHVWIERGPNLDFIQATRTDAPCEPISLWEWKARRKHRGRPADVYEDQRGERIERKEGQIAAAKKATRAARKKEKERRNELDRITPKAPKLPNNKKPEPLSAEKIAELRKKLSPPSLPK